MREGMRKGRKEGRNAREKECGWERKCAPGQVRAL
jgi:hypothetical protein